MDVPVGGHYCNNCQGIDPGSCAFNRDFRPPDNEAATALARYIGSQPLSVIQAAWRLLGWEMSLEAGEVDG